MKGSLNISMESSKIFIVGLVTFNVKLSSEKNSRKEAKDMGGEGLVAEMAPLIIDGSKGKPMRVAPVPWCYLYNVVGHIK